MVSMDHREGDKSAVALVAAGPAGKVEKGTMNGSGPAADGSPRIAGKIRAVSPAPPAGGYETPSDPGTPSPNIMYAKYAAHNHEVNTDLTNGTETWDGWRTDVAEFVPVGMMANPGDSTALNNTFPAAWAMPGGDGFKGGGADEQGSMSQIRAQFEWQMRSKNDELRDIQNQINQLELENAQASQVQEMEKRKLAQQILSYRTVLERYCIPPEEADSISYADIDESQDTYNHESYEPASSPPWQSSSMDLVQAGVCQPQGSALAALLSGTPMAAGQIGGCNMAVTEEEQQEDSSLDSKMKQLGTLLQGQGSSNKTFGDSGNNGAANGEENSGAIASTLQAMFPHATIRTGRGDLEKEAQKLENQGSSLEDSQSAEEIEVEVHMRRLEKSVDSQVDDRALMALQGLPTRDAKEALRKVEELVQSQGGQCRNLSSILQSVCRKLEKRNKQPPSIDSRRDDEYRYSRARGGYADTSADTRAADAEKDNSRPAVLASPSPTPTSLSRQLTPSNLDTPHGKRSWADIGDFDDDADEVAFSDPGKPAEDDPWTAALVDRVLQKSLEVHANSDKSCTLKIDMASVEPQLTEAGLEKYCNRLHDRLTAFREEHGEYCLQKCGGIVDFSQNNLSNQMVWMLLETLAQHEVHVAILKLTANRISQGGILALCEFMRANEHEYVKELHLSHNEIDDDAAMELLRTMNTRPRHIAAEAPVWVRLNHNRIQNPDQVRRTAEAEGVSICNATDRQACGTNKCCLNSKCAPAVHLYSFNVQATRQPQSAGQVPPSEESSPTAQDSEGANGRAQKRGGKNKKKGEH
eukprot:TRINITY_DN2694_c0_g1_i2.p1 TRINITY_DN2694_c0_g1~~TRINITY_DN2694_c0_g1_i2.p1  ORF type:complete len:810 (-),score=161.05 TRINITY_DN2694_c0_g1_i2:253-2682(-)